ncbi:MAG: Asp-tRNA(Asn)/Glu-tRNA(Gln) amidotransferase subunit GatB [Ignavibacteria bacterium]|nr:Asp-tRNA(Asn)/Glu-tRNA(Gln) amidotransferase subunit GatB [Ignavibacteria bacterium]
MKLNDAYEPVIGLEVHAQLLTASKAFCSCSTQFGVEPNSNVCPVCLGMPGTLPVLNRNLVEFIIRMGLATGCSITPRSVFARKNYFYPDLPKGYQISQFDLPLCTGGSVEIDLDDGSRKTIRLTRIHMEEDAGKSIHDIDVDTLVDVNRCGVPLIEIVSEPDMRSPREAYLFLTRIRQLVTYLGICDGNMEEGSLRADANISVRRKGTTPFGTKTEVKNMNSFRYVERALEFEINRQIQVLTEGGTVAQETLLWDANLGVAIPMRSKEEAHDYRYFPDPDLVPVLVEEAWTGRIRESMPELPTVRRDRFESTLGLPRYDADVLTAEKETADYFEDTLQELTNQTGRDRKDLAKPVSNWVMTDILRVMGERKLAIGQVPISPVRLAGMIRLILDGTISGTIAKELFEEMLGSDEDPESIVERKGLVQVSDHGVLSAAIQEVLDNSPDQVRKYINGSDKVFGFFVGQTMKKLQGKGNPSVINELLRKKLDGLKSA